MAADSDNEEDFVSFGTPLEPLEEDEPLKKPVPIYEQTVKDEKGRYQRFHGAFTGGFSAGYYNTVGSKEGWTPSTFKSSRQNKAEKQQVRPVDFMDEEDLGEHGIAPSEITRSEEFSSGRTDEARDKARAVNAQASLIPGDILLEEIIAPAQSSIGVELLKTMGWKEGQGVGPRVKRKPRKQKKASLKTYGCALPPTGSEGSEEEDDEEFAPENVTFAPKDVIPFDFTPRLGVQGLGYRGLDPGRALLGRGSDHINLFDPQFNSREQLFRDKQKHTRHKGVAGQAFGVGALEDEDEDIYQRDSISKYDTEIREEEPGDGLFGWTAPQEYTQKKKDQNKDASYIGKILEGFTLAENAEVKITIFPPPILPRDYRPVRRLHPGTIVSHLTGVSPALAEALRTSRGHMVKEEPQMGRHQLDSGQRRALLGEDSLQGPSSIMDLLRPEDRERLQKHRNSNSLPKSSVSQDASRPPASSSTSSSKSSSKSTPSSVIPPSFHQQQQQEALSAWRGQTTAQTFRPFENNPEKQTRYENYLSRLKQGENDALEQSLDTEMTEWERGREREEFVRSSILYRPTSSSLSSRFTRGKQQDDEETVEVNRDEEGDEDDKQAAVQMKMFGKLTRETFEWHPDKVLCKRFNVPDPYPGSGLVGFPKVKRDKFSVFNFLTVSERETSAPPPKPLESVKKSRWDVSEEMKNQIDPLSEMLSAARSQASESHSDQTTTSEPPALPAPVSRNDQSTDTQTEAKGSKEPSNKARNDDSSDEDSDSEEEETRPPMDVFKAIFSSSDEKSSSESENEEEPKDARDQTHVTHNLFNISSTVTKATTSVTKATTSVTTATTAVPATAAAAPQTSKEEFGPKLPPPSSAFIGGGAPGSSPSSEDKLRKSKDKKHKTKKEHKHKKEKKKKKHKKHKHKGKHKKSKREESSSDSGEDSEGNTAEVSTEDLLKRLKTIRSNQCPL